MAGFFNLFSGKKQELTGQHEGAYSFDLLCGGASVRIDRLKDSGRFRGSAIPKKLSDVTATDNAKDIRPYSNGECPHLQSYLKSKRISIIECIDLPNGEDLLTQACVYVGNNYDITRGILEQIKSRISKAYFDPRKTKFSYPPPEILNITDSEYREIRQMGQKLSDYGIINSFKASDDRKVITYKLSEKTIVRQLITGTWLEQYAAVNAENTVREFCEKHGYHFEMLCDTAVQEIVNSNRHELDLVFTVEDKFFAMEFKSGENSPVYTDYVTLCEKVLKLPKSQFLMFISTLGDKHDLRKLRGKYGLRFANMNTFTQEIVEMLNEAFGISATE